MIELIGSTLEHVRELGQNLRENDKREIRALGMEPHRGLWRSYKISLIRKTVILNGKVAAMLGCAGDPLGSVGRPWFLTSPHVEEVSPLVFAFLYRQQMKEMLKLFPHLVNYVHTAYVDSIKLMKIIGFSETEKIPLPPYGEMFSRMEIKRTEESAEMLSA